LFSIFSPLLMTTPVSAQAATDKFTFRNFELYSPSSLKTDSMSAMRVLNALWDAVKTTRGLPLAVARRGSIKIAMATQPNADADAVSFVGERIIVLPSRRWLAWSSGKLDRVLQHEVGHIVIAEYLGSSSIPHWLDEGFAEWSAGALSCEYETMLRFDLVGRGIRRPRLVVTRSSLDGGFSVSSGTAAYSRRVQECDATRSLTG